MADHEISFVHGTAWYLVWQTCSLDEWFRQVEEHAVVAKEVMVMISSAQASQDDHLCIYSHGPTQLFGQRSSFNGTMFVSQRDCGTKQQDEAQINQLISI